MHQYLVARVTLTVLVHWHLMQLCMCVDRTHRHLVSNLLEVNAAHEVHLATVNLQDVKPRPLIGIGKLNLPVNPARPKQCSIQYVYSVGSHQHLQVCTQYVTI